MFCVFYYITSIIKFAQEHYEEWSIENNKLPRPVSVMEIQIRKESFDLGNPNAYIQFKQKYSPSST